MLLEYKPGMSLTDPWAWTLQSRVNPGFQVAKNLTLKSVGATVVRDAHYIGGTRTTLFEAGETNSCLQSQALATTWTTTNLTATNNNAAAPDGTTTATKLVPTVTNGFHNVNQTIAVTAGENIAVSCFFQASGYVGVQINVNPGGARFASWAFNLSGAGAASAGAPTGYVSNGQTVVALGGGWYWCGAWFTSLTDATINFQIGVYDTYAHAQASTTFAGDTTSGIYAWGAQFERNGTAIAAPPTSYIATTTGALGRNPDVISTPWPFQTMPMWLYMKYTDLGWGQRAAFDVGPQWSDSSSNKPHLQIFTGSGALGATPNNRINWRPNTGPSSGANQVSAIITPGAAYNDTVELFCRFMNGANIVELNRSINGGAVTQALGAATGGTPMVDFVTPTLFFLNVSGTLGLQVLRVGADPTRITTLAQAAAA